MKRIVSALFMLIISFSLALPAAAATSVQMQPETMKQALFVILLILVVLVLGCIVFSWMSSSRKGRFDDRPEKDSGKTVIRIALYAATVLVLAVFIFCILCYRNALNEANKAPVLPPETTTQAPETTAAPTTEETTLPEETTEATTVPETTVDPLLNFAPAMTQNSDPSTWNIKWEIQQNKKTVTGYTREDPISFGDPEDYFTLPGIATFRGNNYRNSASYGTATVVDKDLKIEWSRGIGSFNGWSGSGWTGQPLIVQWDEETKQIMNLYDSKKAKENLVEVVYATLDGHIYFYDLDDGSYTRDPINMQMNFKGAGALDPRGYPLLYVGGGIYQDNKAPRMYVVSLITGEILYTHGNGDGFARRNWSAFDSSPLVDASSDTLIWPGENGVLYTIKLNTSYDKEAGTISVDPDYPVKTRYTSPTSKKRYYGYESSASVVDHWLYVSENSGMFYCVDLNTMELVWAQDTKDDSNSSPIFEWGPDNQGYIYTAPSLHWTAKNNKGSVSVYKLNAQTGEIVWERPFECMTVPDLSGGVQSSPILGKEGTVLEDTIIYNISRVPSTYKGVLVAMDTETGETIWEASTGNYAWSSPVPIYTEDGKAYIFLCDAEGNAKLYDGETGEILDKVSFGSTVEASPIVFNNKIIIGSRGGKAYCLTIS